MKNLPHLIPCSQFVLEQAEKRDGFRPHATFVDPMINYAKLLTTPLTLSMFIPVSDDGEVLSEPVMPWQDRIMEQGIHAKYKLQKAAYEKALSRVLFEGFEIKEWKSGGASKTVSYQDVVHVYWYDDITQEWKASQGIKTIEKLCNYSLPLTQAANKLIFGE